LQNQTDYILGRMMVGSGYNLQAGYLTRSGLSLDARYTLLQPGAHSFLYNGTFYNRPSYFTASVGKYFQRNYSFSIRAALTLVGVDSGSNDHTGSPIDDNEVLFRLITTYAF